MNELAFWTLGVNIFTVFVLLGTAVIIYFYTVHTYNLLNETKKQTELSLKPFVIVLMDQCFYVENVGNGVAREIEVEIEDLCFKGKKVTLNFIERDYLHVGERRDLGIKITVDRENNLEKSKKNSVQYL